MEISRKTRLGEIRISQKIIMKFKVTKEELLRKLHLNKETLPYEIELEGEPRIRKLGKIENIDFMQTTARARDSFTDDTCVALQVIKRKLNEIINRMNTL